MIEVKQEHLQFDRAHLEWAILNQASLFDLYASECARQQSKVDKIKNQVAKKGSLNNMRPPTGCCLPMQTI